jgi:hypothetical protein
MWVFVFDILASKVNRSVSDRSPVLVSCVEGADCGTSSLLGAEVLVAASTPVNISHFRPTTRSSLPPYAPLSSRTQERETVTAPYCATTIFSDRSIAHLDRIQSHHRKRNHQAHSNWPASPCIQNHKVSFEEDWPYFAFLRSVGASFDTAIYRQICTRPQDICRHPSHTRRLHHEHT